MEWNCKEPKSLGFWGVAEGLLFFRESVPTWRQRTDWPKACPFSLFSLGLASPVTGKCFSLVIILNYPSRTCGQSPKDMASCPCPGIRTLPSALVFPLAGKSRKGGEKNMVDPFLPVCASLPPTWWSWALTTCVKIFLFQHIILHFTNDSIL